MDERRLTAILVRAIGISCPFDSVCLIYFGVELSWETPINKEMVVLFTRLTFYNSRVSRWFINRTEVQAEESSNQ